MPELKKYRKIDTPKHKKDYLGQLLRVLDMPSGYYNGGSKMISDPLIADGSVLKLRQRYTDGHEKGKANLVLDWHCPLCNHAHERNIDESYLADGRAEFVEEDGPADGAERVVYLAGPYTHPMEQVMEARWLELSRAAGFLIGLGFTVISPVSMGHPIRLLEKGVIKPEFSAWAPTCLHLLRTAGILCLVPLNGYAESVGLKAEVKLARELGKTITVLRRGDGGEWGFPVYLHQCPEVVL